ncbi:hypothetical protein MGSAQ_001704, partial [marine sediment metagenome]
NTKRDVRLVGEVTAYQSDNHLDDETSHS